MINKHGTYGPATDIAVGRCRGAGIVDQQQRLDDRARIAAMGRDQVVDPPPQGALFLVMSCRRCAHRRLYPEFVPILFTVAGESRLAPESLWSVRPRHGILPAMCNLYSIMSNPDAIRAFTRALVDTTGNFEPLPGVYPDYLAPIVRNTPAGRELARVRWGMPTPTSILHKAADARANKLEARGKLVARDALRRAEPDAGVTNVRNAKSPHWRRWLGVESRCIVPFTSFSELGSLNQGAGLVRA